jgi:hypothetical protein
VASANLELVRSIYAASRRGDYSSIDWAHPEIELVVADGTRTWELEGTCEVTRSKSGRRCCFARETQQPRSSAWSS